MPIFQIISTAFNRLDRYRPLALLGLAGLIVVIGTVLFSLTQHVSIGVAFYWAVTTATTVGYGDVLPHNTAGRAIAIGVMLTAIPLVGAVFALLASISVLSHLRRLIGLDTHLPTNPYTVVYGSHPIVPRVLEELERTGNVVVLVAPAKPPGVSDSVHFLAGDPTDPALVRASAPQNANQALIAAEADADTLVIAVSLHHCAPDLEALALTQSPAVARALLELGVTHTLSSNELVGHTIAKSLETPGAGHLLLQIVDTENYRLVDVPVSPELVAKPLSQARGRAGLLVLGVRREHTVDLGVGEDPVLEANDRMIVLEPIAAKS
jgi:voltage-gated potassium channel